MATLQEIRREVGFSLNELILATVSSATPTTVTSSDLVDSIASSETLEGGYVRFSDGSERRIASYDPETGTITLSRSISPVPPYDSTFEIHQMLPASEIDRIINRVLENLFYVDRAEVEVGDDGSISLEGIDGLAPLYRIFSVSVTLSPNATRYSLVSWEVVEEDDGHYLRVPAWVPARTVEIEFLRPYGALSSDSDTTDCPLPWVASGTRMEILTLISRRAPTEDARRFLEAVERERVAFTNLSKMYAPRPKVVVKKRV